MEVSSYLLDLIIDLNRELDRYAMHAGGASLLDAECSAIHATGNNTNGSQWDCSELSLLSGGAPPQVSRRPSGATGNNRYDDRNIAAESRADNSQGLSFQGSSIRLNLLREVIASARHVQQLN